MTLIKSKRSTPIAGNSLMNDLIFSDPFDTRRSIINRLFNGDSEKDLQLTPAVNVRERKNRLEMEIAAPGLNKEDFKISIDDGILNISAEKETKEEEEKEGFMRKEFSYHSFSRSFSLPDDIDEDKEVKAKYEDGLLKLMLHKKEGKKKKEPKKIEVS